MTRILKIERCQDCKYRGECYTGPCCLNLRGSGMTFRPIDDVDTIPDWCPLEDDLGVGAAPYRTIEVYYIREMHDVLVRAYRHRKTWMLESKEYWLTKLVQEVGELALSLQGEHEHPPGLELEQIAAICLNWMRHRRRGYIDQDHQG